jgi:hypothetical protein
VILAQRPEFVMHPDWQSEFRTQNQRHMQPSVLSCPFYGVPPHRRGVCVVAVFTKDVAEAKATSATDAGRRWGYPLLFTTEPEE